MKTKVFEIRDKNTFIPVIGILMEPEQESEGYLLRRAGYGGPRCVLLTRLEGGGRGSQYNPYEWGDRTYRVAHQYITKEWSNLNNGDVIDVEFILGETQVKKESEQFEGGYF
jgi:hypothetical protein